MSAKFPDEVEQELRNIGFDVSKLVTKPFKVPLLIETIKWLLWKLGFWAF